MALALMRNIQINLQLLHYFHTSSCSNAKTGKAMRKVMGLASKKKRRYIDTPILPSPSEFSKGSYEGKSSTNSKRSTVLNKLFMRYITDLMANGENCEEYLGHGIEIHRVQITPDYKGLNVFWIAKGTDDDEIVQNILNKNAGYLRHELSTLKVMGAVPLIRFIKDKQYAQIMEVDIRLAKADFGDDYIPTEISSKLKAQLELFTPLDDKIRQQIKELEVDNEVDIVEEEPLPQMPQDVFGLNHSDILNRVKKSMKKSEAAHRLMNCNEENSIIVQTVNENPVEYSGNKARRAAFKEFLQKRERLRRQAGKENKNYYPDLEYLQEEFKSREQKFYENLDIYDNINVDDCDDYFSEEELSK